MVFKGPGKIKDSMLMIKELKMSRDYRLEKSPGGQGDWTGTSSPNGRLCECVYMCALKGIFKMQWYIFLWLESKDCKKYGDDVIGDRSQIKSRRANIAMRQKSVMRKYHNFSKISKNTNLGVTVTILWSGRNHKDILCPYSLLGFIIAKGSRTINEMKT